MDIQRPHVSPPDFEKEERSLLQLARRLIGLVEADDVVQDTWLAALESGWDRSIENPRWLRAVLRKRALFARRSAARRRNREIDSARPEMLERTNDPADVHAIRERLLVLVDSLQEPERSVVRLRFWSDLGLTEIARRLGRSHNTVKSQYRRGMQILRARLDRESDGGRGAWMPALIGWIASTDRRPPRAALAARSFSPATLVVAAASALGLASVVLAFRDASERPLPSMGEITREIAVSAAVSDTSEQPALERLPVDAIDAPSSALETVEAASASGASARVWRVRAVDASGRAVESARVFVNGRAHEATTDAAGRAELQIEAGARNDLARELFPGRLTFFGEHEGHLRTDDHHVDPGSFAGTEITLVFEHEFQSVRGRVLDRSGRALADAMVGLFDHSDAYSERPDGVALTSPEERCRTDADGRFEIPGRSVSGTQIHVEKDGWAPFVGDVTQSMDESGELEVELGPGVVLSGVVLDVDGYPIAGAVVRFTSLGGVVQHETKTDERGLYRTANLSPGENMLWAHHPSIESIYASELVVAVPNEELEWSPRLAEHRPFRVRVLDADDGGGAGLYCQLQHAFWYVSSEADESGWTAPFTTYPDAPISFVIRDVALPNAMPLVVVRGQLPDGEDVEVRLPPDVRRGAPIRGIVHACDGEPPGEEFALTLVHEPFLMVMPWFEIDADTGAFCSQAQPPGNYLLVVSMRAGGMYAFPSFDLVPGEPLDLGVLALPPAGTLEVHTRGSVTVATSLSLELVRQIGSHTTYLLFDVHEVQGACSELRLLPGTYRLRAWRDEIELASSTVTVVSGLASEITLGE